MFSPEKEAFFDSLDAQHIAVTFDDVRLRTMAQPDEAPPTTLDIRSNFSEHVGLKVPFVSAAMDTVTEGTMAIAMAKLGGLGVIHAAMSIDEQRKEVRRVKKHINGLIESPITVRDTDSLETILSVCSDKQYDFRTFPVLNADGTFVGILGSKDFEYPDSMDITAAEAMTEAHTVLSSQGDTGLVDAYRTMQARKISTLPLLHDDGSVAGLYLFSDVSRIFRDSVQYNVDENGRLLVAAAVSTGKDTLERVEALHKHLDVVVIDTADGDSYYAFQTLRDIKAAFPDLDVVVGNISDGESARLLAQAGANGIKIGQGPGSICTTRRETGIGTPQVTAVYQAIRALGEEYAHIPVCADGGIKDHGDISIAFAAGAHSVMMGRMFAGTEEAPGQVVVRGDGSRVKLYRGMGSLSALRDNEASRLRYGANAKGQFLAEGVESQVPYDGLVEDVLDLCQQALVKSMRTVKAPCLTHHRERTRMIRMTTSGLRESHPHDVSVTKGH